MYFSNLIQIFPTAHVIKSTDKAEGLPSTINQAKPKIPYNKQDLTALSHNNVNLTELPTGTISTIRRLKLNKKKIRKKNTRSNVSKLGSTFATYTRFKL